MPIVGRYFNYFINTENGILKTSEHIDKLKDEIYWYLNIPSSLQKYIPNIITYSETVPFIEMEKYENDFNTLYRDNVQLDWAMYFDKILDSLIEIHQFDADGVLDKVTCDFMYIDKTKQRINDLDKRIFSKYFKDFEYNNKKLFGLNTFLENLDDIANKIYIASPKRTIIHGDYHLGNIVKNDNTIKFIDPRGNFGIKSIYGQDLYDWAKLSHDVLWDYGLISHDQFEYRKNHYDIKITESQLTIKELMKSKLLNKLPVEFNIIGLICSLLFISMVPLHKDDIQRQKVLLIRGLELFKEFYV